MAPRLWTKTRVYLVYSGIINKLNLLCIIDSSSVKPDHIPCNQTLYLLGYICALCKIMPNKNMLCYVNSPSVCFKCTVHRFLHFIFHYLLWTFIKANNRIFPDLLRIRHTSNIHIHECKNSYVRSIFDALIHIK